jgi:hypothetical protein
MFREHGPLALVSLGPGKELNALTVLLEVPKMGAPMFPASAAIVAAIWLSALAARAEAPSVTSVIDLATKGTGGREHLQAVKAAVWEAKISYELDDVRTKVTAKYAIQLPCSVREELTLPRDGQLCTQVRIIAGSRGWERPFCTAGEKAKWGNIESEEMIADYQEWVRQMRIVFLPSEMIAPGRKTTLAGQEKIGQRPCTGIKVSEASCDDLTLFYDNSMGTLVKAVMPAHYGLLLTKVPISMTFRSYRSVNGVQVSFRVHSVYQGHTFREIEVEKLQIKRHYLIKASSSQNRKTNGVKTS